MYLKRLKNLREDHDYTQEFVSKYLGINRVVYSRYENGYREIKLTYLIKLSKLYNVSVDYLLNLTNIKNTNKEKQKI